MIVDEVSFFGVEAVHMVDYALHVECNGGFETRGRQEEGAFFLVEFVQHEHTLMGASP